MADMHKVGARNKRSGNSLENLTAHIFSDWYGKEFHRSPGSGSLHWKSVNVNADVLPPDDIDFPFIVECKSDKASNWTIESFMDSAKHFPTWNAQAIREGVKASDGLKYPILVFKRNYVKPYFSIPYSSEIAKSFDDNKISYAVSNIQYVSELDHCKYSYHTLSAKLDIVVSTYSPNDFEKLFNFNWLDNIVKLSEPETENVDAENVIKGIDI